MKIVDGSSTCLESAMPSLAQIYSKYVARDYSSIDLESVLQSITDANQNVTFQIHPLGFIHGELSPCVPLSYGERFRLHIWLSDAGSLDQLGDLHEHTWNLTSLVLAGGVLDRNYEAIPTPRGTFSGSRIMYGPQNTATPLGEYDLRLTEERTVSAGNVYSIPSRTIHLNQISQVPTVTLVRSVEDGRGDGPLVLTPQSVGQGVATGVRTEIDAFDVLARLRAAMAK